MVTTLLSLLATAAIGATVARRLAGQGVHPALLIGGGYGLGVTVIGGLLPALSWAGLSLSSASWLLIGISLSVIVAAASRRYFTAAKSHVVTPTVDILGPSLRSFSYWDALISLFIVIHIGFAVIGNTAPEIFPWDAFTTWMYRAKAWALTDTISPMMHTSDWIAAQGQTGYAIYASEYPATLSAYAAFASSIDGGWSVTAASLPWSGALLALSLGNFGLGRMAGFTPSVALISTFFLVSGSLITTHATLAGYADIWMVLTAGMGLASLLVYRVTGRSECLRLGLLLLLVASQIKREGWLWLGTGGLFLLLTSSTRPSYTRYKWGALGLIAGFSVVAWLTGYTVLSLGPLGQWGVTEKQIFAGFLGAYELNIRNPIDNYTTALFQRANFHLLAMFLSFALIYLGFKRQAVVWPSLFMLGLIIAVQSLIFGASAYSQYAEDGTAMARVLMQLSPAFISIIGFSLQAVYDNRAPGKPRNPLTLAPTSIGIAFVACCLAFLAPRALTLGDARFDKTWQAVDMISVVGDTQPKGHGLSFKHSPSRVGVLKISSDFGEFKPPLVVVDARVALPGQAYFYWVPVGPEPNLQRRALATG